MSESLSGARVNGCAPGMRDSAPEYESYFIEYAMQKEMINRNRCPASRRLLSQTAHLDFNFSNSNHSKVGPRPGDLPGGSRL